MGFHRGEAEAKLKLKAEMETSERMDRLEVSINSQCFMFVLHVTFTRARGIGLLTDFKRRFD